MLICALATALMLASQQPVATPVPRRPVAPATATVEIRVTNRSGTPVDGVHVTALGPSVREDDTAANGVVVFKGLNPGTYRIRAEHDGLITLEKELSVKAAAAPVTTQLALSAAPAPPPPPEPVVVPPPAAALPPPAPELPTGARGETRVLSMTDLAERSLNGKDSVKVVPIGCTGLTNARMIVLRDTLPAASYSDADENLYLMAGEATVTIDAKEQSLTPGWFAQLPRGTKFEVVRKGRNPVIFMSLLNGRPCGEGASAEK